jgi:hypothetical protein
MIGCKRWFVGGTKDEHLPHDGATGDGSEEQSWWCAITKRDTHSTLHLLSSTFRNNTLSEPRFRGLLTEGGAKHLALEWT